MSKIDIVIAEAPEPVKTIATLRRFIPAASVSDLRDRIATGAPVVEVLLFESNHGEVATLLRGLVAELPSTGARLRVFELRPGESFAEVDLSTKEITPQVLTNILDESDAIDAEM